MKIEKVTLIGLGAMGVFFAPRLSEKLGAGFRILADGARKERLEHKGVTVNQIADELNFPNPSFFSKFFKRMTGMTPGEYRNE